jgi:hypothetical protein
MIYLKTKFKVKFRLLFIFKILSVVKPLKIVFLPIRIT